MSDMTKRAYRTFAEQALHYFVRPHESVPLEPLQHLAAWTAQTMANKPEKWFFTLSPEETDEIRQAVDHVQHLGLSLEEISSENFPLPLLVPRLMEWKAMLKSGQGFFALRGLPVEDWGDERSAIAFWGLGHNLGIPGGQNPQNELLGHVKDYDEEGDNPSVRRYRTAGNIDFHCDAADVVGLLCLRKAKSGGQSRIASSTAIYNEILKQNPDLAQQLFEPMLLDLRGEHKPGDAPVRKMVPAAFAKGDLKVFWHSEYFRSSDRHQGYAFSQEQTELLDLFDNLAASPEFHIDMWLEPGDMQFISNHTIVHARTEYEDGSGDNEKRHLLRLWLSV